MTELGCDVLIRDYMLSSFHGIVSAEDRFFNLFEQCTILLNDVDHESIISSKGLQQQTEAYASASTFKASFAPNKKISLK